jgi:hypothetical protein
MTSSKLISIIDSLSPNFVQVLEPGEDYVGGQEFFSNNFSYVRVIPPQDVPTNANPLNVRLPRIGGHLC